MTIPSAHSSSDACRKRNLEELQKLCEEANLERMTWILKRQERENQDEGVGDTEMLDEFMADWDESGKQSWSFKSQHVDEVVTWINDNLELDQEIQRLTLDVSNVLYSFFINIDKILYSHLANNRQEWSQLLLEHRFLELRKLNAVFDFLLEKFPTATILDSIFDHATDRRWTKIIAEVTRQDALAAAKAKRLAVEATKLYEKNGGKAAGCPPPQIDMSTEELRFPAFSPTTDAELILPLNPTPLQQAIHREAVKLAGRSNQIVSRSEADSVCRDASVGLKPDIDFPTASYRSANPQLLLPPPSSSAQSVPSSPLHRPSSSTRNESFQLPAHDTTTSLSSTPLLPPPKGVAIIIGNDSDHLGLNDHLSAAFVFGLSSTYDCRATALKKRFDHHSDWKFVDRFASTLAMVICGCDESKGFDGFTVPGVGRSGRPVSNLSAKQQEERTILAICNAWLSLLQAYNQAIVGGGTTSLTGADSTTFVVDSDGLEAYFRRIFEPMFRPTPKQPTYQFTFKGMMECWLGLVAQDYVVVDKNLWRKEAEIRLQTRINADLAIIHSGESRNHSFGPPGKPAEARELPANPQRAYHVVKGSDSLKFLRDGKEADELLALKQSQSSDTEKFTTVIAAPAKKTQKKAKVDDPEEEGTTSKAPGEGRGLKKLLFSLSAMPMPLRVSTFANLLYPGIPEGHQFHFDLVNVLNTLLNVWLNECPLIVEIVTSLLSRYWEFAPQLLLDCASNPQEFGSRVATLIIHTKQWYVDEEKRTSQDPDPSQPPRPLQPYPPHQLPSWLETQVVDFLPSLNPRHELAFRQLVASSQFVEGEFKFNNLFDLIGAIVIKERARYRFPPPILTHSTFLVMNFTTAGTGLMNACDARGRSLSSFLAGGVLESILDLPSRIEQNLHELSTIDVKTALSAVSRIHPTLHQDLLSAVQSKSIKRLVSRRIFSARLPTPSPTESPPIPPNDRPNANILDEEEEKEKEEEEEEEEREVYTLEDMLMNEGENVENEGSEEDDAGSDYEFDDGDEDEGADSDMEIGSTDLEEALLDRITLTLQDAVLRKPTNISGSHEIREGAAAFAKLITTSVDFLVKHVGCSYVEATRFVSMSGKCTRIGDLAVGAGGKELKFGKREKFLDVSLEHQEDEEPREEEDEDVKTKRVKKVLRLMVLEVLPLLNKPFFRFKPRGCDVDLSILKSITKKPPHNSKAAYPSDYLPNLAETLLHRLVVESRNANALFESENVTFPSFKIPSIIGMEDRDPVRITYKELERWTNDDDFVKDQARNPKKILLISKDYWPQVEFIEEPSKGPYPVRRLTENGRQTFQDQSQSLQALFKHLDLTQADLTQVSHELMNWMLKPSIGNRLYHGNFHFNRFQIIPLVFDPRSLTKQGWNKFEARVKGMSWPAALELLASEHSKMVASYTKLESKNSAGLNRRPQVKSSSSQGGAARVVQTSRNAELDPIFATHSLRGKTGLRLLRTPQRQQAPPRLDDRQGLFLPFRQRISPTGAAALERWSEWVRDHIDLSDEAVQFANDIKMLPSPTPPPSSSQPLAPPVPQNHSSSATSASVASYSVASSSRKSPISLRPTSSSIPRGPAANRNPSTPVLQPVQPSPRMTISGSSALTTTSDPTPSSTSTLDPLPGSSATLIKVVDKKGKKTAGYIIANDLGRRVSVDSALLGVEGPMKFFRTTSGAKNQRDRRVQKRRAALLPIDARGRFVKGLQDATGDSSNDLPTLLQQSSPVPRTGTQQLPFDSLSSRLPPLLQPSLLHVEDYLGSKRNFLAQQKRRAQLDKTTSEQWRTALPRPADGSKIPVALITAYGGITGGSGYGRRDEQERESSMIRVLKGMEWIDLIHIRSSEAYSSQVCSDPSCGGAVIHPCRLDDPKQSFNLRLVVCIRCFKPRHRDDNAAANIARLALARARGVHGNVLSPANAELLGNLFRGSKSQVKTLESRLRKYFEGCSEPETRRKLTELKKGDSLLALLEETSTQILELEDEYVDVDRQEDDDSEEEA